jgi:PTH1 family peptidyl-tRNA hydrolase
MKFLIIGLGNPGVKYQNTRHNIGFKALDYVSKHANAFFSSVRYGELSSFKYKGKSIFLLKPNTYMNLSGNAVNYWIKKENIPLSNLLIITDDINLSIGVLRMKKKGSDGGHNGLKNIQELLLSSSYPRLRIGVGNEFSKGKQVDYVLGDWSKEEEEILEEKAVKIKEMILSFCFAGIENTMNAFNNK